MPSTAAQSITSSIDGDGNFGGPLPIIARSQPVANHLFVTPDGGFDAAALVVA